MTSASALVPTLLGFRNTFRAKVKGKQKSGFLLSKTSAGSPYKLKTTRIHTRLTATSLVKQHFVIHQISFINLTKGQNAEQMI